jgi:hypothetical protein
MAAEENRDRSAASQVADQHSGRLCPKCAAWQRLVHSFLDSARGKTVRVYECHRCGEHIWYE